MRTKSISGIRVDDLIRLNAGAAGAVHIADFLAQKIAKVRIAKKAIPSFIAMLDARAVQLAGTGSEKVIYAIRRASEGLRARLQAGTTQDKSENYGGSGGDHLPDAPGKAQGNGPETLFVNRRPSER